MPLLGNLSLSFLKSSKAFINTMAITGVDSFSLIQSIIPKLQCDLHKGDAGRIGVIGGCKEYTGAPYFAAISALKVGCDLSHVFCTNDAAPVIKSYSPELIVHPILDDRDSINELHQWFPRLHAVIIGPGLGRNEKLLEVIQAAISKAVELDIPVVIDADGLFFVTQHPELVKGHKKIVLTPNAVEFSRLFLSVIGEEGGDSGESVIKLSEHLGNVTIVRKGKTDVISNGSETVACEIEGSARRCGGQGDLLSGAMGVFMHWAYSTRTDSDPRPISPSLKAAYAACWLTRECNRKSFAKCRRSMTTTDMVNEIRDVMIGVDHVN